MIDLRMLTLATLAASTLLTACQSAGPLAPEGTEFFIAPKLRATLPEEACVKEQAARAALLAFEYGERHSRLIVVTSCRAGVLLMDGLSTAGLPLFTLRWDGKHLEASTRVPSQKLPDAKQVLGEHLLASLPASLWQGHLPEEVLLTETKGGMRRVLESPTGTIETIRYAEGAPLEIIHHAFGYRITFTPLEDTKESAAP